MGQKVCSPTCAGRLVRAQKAQGKRELRARKAALKTIPDLLKEARHEVHAYIRLRDRLAGYPCISCASPLDWSGNKVDAGHFRGVGRAPHLRFHEQNIHAQCKHCNDYLAGNYGDYRIGLIERIGLEAVEALEADNRIHRWTREELIAIRDKYRRLTKELRAAREAMEATWSLY
jgi:hypothetical protein